jgi:hypothetical protein
MPKPGWCGMGGMGKAIGGGGGACGWFQLPGGGFGGMKPFFGAWNTSLDPGGGDRGRLRDRLPDLEEEKFGLTGWYFPCGSGVVFRPPYPPLRDLNRDEERLCERR